VPLAEEESRLPGCPPACLFELAGEFADVAEGAPDDVLDAEPPPLHPANRKTNDASRTKNVTLELFIVLYSIIMNSKSRSRRFRVGPRSRSLILMNTFDSLCGGRANIGT